MRVGLIMHCDQTTGRLDDALAQAGAEIERYLIHRNEPIPSDVDFDRVVILGGAMGAYEEGQHPWLADEKKWLRALVERDVPVLGICLGSQMLAAALGGEVYPAAVPEALVVSLRCTDEGKSDPVLSAAGRQVLALHQDTFDLPTDAVLLAESDRYPHAFRVGSALALQFHPDADLEQAKRWGDEESTLLERAGVSLAEFVSDLERSDVELDAASRRLFRAWLASP
ncbi:MAG: type 1 glutamine amidotransferase [Acidimicrobiia bacterium]